MINDPTGLPFLQKKGIENQSTENQYLTRYWLAENQYLANTWPDIGFRFPAVKMVHRLGRSSYTKPERTPAQVGNKRRVTEEDRVGVRSAEPVLLRLLRYGRKGNHS